MINQNTSPTKCPYEKREDRPKDARRNKFPNPVNNNNKRREGKDLVGMKYLSNEEEENIVGVAVLSLAKPGSLFKTAPSTTKQKR